MFNHPTKILTCKIETLLYRQQEHHPWIYHIQQGFVVVYGLSIDGKQGLTDIYGPGSWFGPGLSDGLAILNAKTKPGCIISRLEPHTLYEQPTDNAELIQRLLRQLSEREQQLQHRLLLQQTALLPARLAHLLCYFFDHQGQPCRHDHLRDVELSQQELASMAGGSRQSVSQLLKSWKQAGLIDYTRHYICLVDTDKLREQCQL